MASALAIIFVVVTLAILTVRFNAASLASKLEALERRAEEAVVAGCTLAVGGADTEDGDSSMDAEEGAEEAWYKCSWLTLVSGRQNCAQNMPRCKGVCVRAPARSHRVRRAAAERDTPFLTFHGAAPPLAPHATQSKITFGHTQILSLIPTVYTAVDWPSSFRATASAVQVVSANPFAVIMPRCVSESLAVDGYASLRVSIAFPTVGSAAIGIYYMFKSYLSVDESAFCKRHTCEAVRCVSSKASGDRYCGGSACLGAKSKASLREDNMCAYKSAHAGRGKCRRPRTVTYARMLKAMCISTSALLFYFVYPILTVNSVRILASCHVICTDEDLTECTSYMRSDYSLSCDTSTHTGYRVVAGLVFAVVSIAAPLVLAVVLHRYRSEFLNADEKQTPGAFTLGLGFFFRPFKDALIYWESVDLFRKLFITSLVVFIGSGSPLQLYAGILFSGTFWLIDGFKAPYDHPAENALQALFGGALFATLVLGGMRQAGQDGLADVADDAITAWIMIFNVGVLLAVVVLAVLNAVDAHKARKARRGGDGGGAAPGGVERGRKLSTRVARPAAITAYTNPTYDTLPQAGGASVEADGSALWGFGGSAPDAQGGAAGSGAVQPTASLDSQKSKNKSSAKKKKSKSAKGKGTTEAAEAAPDSGDVILAAHSDATEPSANEASSDEKPANPKKESTKKKKNKKKSAKKAKAGAGAGKAPAVEADGQPASDGTMPARKATQWNVNSTAATTTTTSAAEQDEDESFGFE